MNFGIIGCGGMGRGHVEAALRNPGFKLTAVCDVNPAAFAGVPEDVPLYAKAEEMFAEHRLDIVSIVLPNYLYESAVGLAAKHGANVLCEKPLGQDLARCRRIIETARAHGVRGWVSSQRKYLPHFIAARKKLTSMDVDFVNVIFTYYWSPAFADPGWRGDLSKSGGIAVIDSGWHVFDALHWLIGNPATVFAQLGASRTRPEVDEKAAIQFRYPSGALANLTISYTVPQNTFEFLFTDQQKAVVITYDDARYFEGGQLTETIKVEEKFDAMDSMYAELLVALREPEATPYLTTFAQAGEIMATVDACYRSAASGEVVKPAA